MADEHEDEQQRGRRWAWVAFFLVALPVFYVLSYAPAVRFGYPYLGFRSIRFAYRPVGWIIENTRLCGPLLDWAEFNGVENQFIVMHYAQSKYPPLRILQKDPTQHLPVGPHD